MSDAGKGRKPLGWIGSSKKDLLEFPDAVIREIGKALAVAQEGGKAPSAKPLKMKGLGAGVLEVVENHDGDTYRAVYTVRFKGVVYALHCFEKKSTKGIKTAKKDIDLVGQRLKEAQAEYEEWQARNREEERDGQRRPVHQQRTRRPRRGRR